LTFKIFSHKTIQNMFNFRCVIVIRTMFTYMTKYYRLTKKKIVFWQLFNARFPYLIGERLLSRKNFLSNKPFLIFFFFFFFNLKMFKILITFFHTKFKLFTLVSLLLDFLIKILIYFRTKVSVTLLSKVGLLYIFSAIKKIASK